MTGILIVAEVDGGAVKPDYWELATLAGQLRKSVAGDLAAAVVVGPGEEIEASEFAAEGVGTVHVLDGEGLGDPWAEAHAEALGQLCGELGPDVVVLPPTLLGEEVAARLALRLGASLVQGVINVEVDASGLRGKRYVYGGAAIATVEASQDRHVLVPRPGAYAAASSPPGSSPEVLRHHVSLASLPKSRFVAVTKQVAAVANIKAAKVLVSGGNGVGGAQGFELLQEVADLLGGVVSASRPPCDAGWVDRALQVGLTGKTVAPDLYLAVGISGAIQHLLGCSSAKTIVAVNTDKGAPIFRASTLGVAGDWKEVVTGLRDALRAASAES